MLFSASSQPRRKKVHRRKAATYPLLPVHAEPTTVFAMPAPTRVTGQKRHTHTDELPKDDIELRLEKALFGDDAGFLKSLKINEAEEDWSLARREGEVGNEAEEGNADGGLDNVADEDVRAPSSVCFSN